MVSRVLRPLVRQATACNNVCSAEACPQPNDMTCKCAQTAASANLACKSCQAQNGGNVTQLQIALHAYVQQCSGAGHAIRFFTLTPNESLADSSGSHSATFTSTFTSAKHSATPSTPLSNSTNPPITSSTGPLSVATNSPSSTNTDALVNNFSPSKSSSVGAPGPNIAAIAGGIGAALAVLLAAVVFWVLRKKKMRRGTFRVLHLDKERGDEWEGPEKQRSTPTPFIGGDALLHSRTRAETPSLPSGDPSRDDPETPLLDHRQYLDNSPQDGNVLPLSLPSSTYHDKRGVDRVPAGVRTIPNA